MNYENGQIAQDLLSTLISKLPHVAYSESSRDEAIRLAALNLVLSIWAQKNTPGISCPQMSEMSFAWQQQAPDAERLAVNGDDLAESWLSPGLIKHIGLLPIRGLGSLLSEIHLSSYRMILSNMQQAPSLRYLGSFQTPFEISDYIASNTLDPILKALFRDSDALKDLKESVSSLSILDPACGTGAFLLSAALIFQQRCMNEKLADCDELVRLFTESLYGVDLDPAALEISDTLLSLAIRSDSGGFFGTNLKRGNSLVSPRAAVDYHERTGMQPSFIPGPFFDWVNEFDDILSGEVPGFDCVIMNPPYRRLRPTISGFIRERLEIGKREVDMNGYDRYQMQAKAESDFFRHHAGYELANRYTIDTYRLFIERMLSITHRGSQMGFIVPASLLADLSARRLRQSLLRQNNVRLIVEYPESSRLFPGVSQAFSIVFLERGQSSSEIRVSFGLPSIGDIGKEPPLRITVEELETYLGTDLVIPQIKHVGWRILKKMHRFPHLKAFQEVSIHRGELDLTNDKGFISNNNTGYPLIRGSDITRYSLIKPIDANEFVDIASLTEDRPASTRTTHHKALRLACQQISNRMQRWRLKFSILSANHILANSCNYLRILNTDERLRYYLLGILNSTLMNWRFNATNSNNHVSNRELAMLPIARIKAETKDEDELRSLLIDAVKQRLSGRSEYEYAIEALVFRIYGLSNEEATHVLSTMNATKEEISQIRRLLSRPAS